MTVMTLEVYQAALAQRIHVIKEINYSTAHIARQMLSPICNMVQTHLTQEFKAHFSNQANAPKYFYKQGWALRGQECTYLEALITRANITKDDGPLVEALSWIQRQAPVVGYLGSGRQYNFQKELSNVLNHCDKEAAPIVDIKVAVPLDEIVRLRTNAAEGKNLANSLSIAANNKDEKAKISVATILQTQDLKKADAADCVAIAILEMQHTIKQKYEKELREERGMHEKTIHDSKAELAKVINENNLLRTDCKMWQDRMQTQIMPDLYGPNKNSTAEGSCSTAARPVTKTPSASAPPPSLFYTPAPPLLNTAITAEGTPSAATAVSNAVVNEPVAPPAPPLAIPPPPPLIALYGPAAAKTLVHS